MFMKNFSNGKICLTLVIIQKIQSFFDDTNKTVIGKMKDEYGGVIIDEFIGLKSKMYSIKKIDGSESSTAKGVNIATEFNEFKDVLFNKKLLNIKWKEYKLRNIKYELMKLIKYLHHVLDDGVHTLAYFHKASHKL